MADRYIISWIPKADVEAFAKRHAAQLASGMSVWDIRPAEHFEKHEYANTEEVALARAKDLAPRDQSGEIHLYHKTAPHANDPSWEWDTVGRAVVYEDSAEIEWLSERDA